jgi:hypothetical protein
MRLAKACLQSCHLKILIPVARTTGPNQIFGHFSGSPRTLRTTRPLPFPRERKIERARFAFKFNGYVMGSTFFVREIFSVRPFRSMPSHVRRSYMAVRSKPVCMARSSSGSWSIHSGFDRIASRSGKNASIPDRDEPHYCIEPVASVPTRTGRGSVQHCDCLLASV